jgi:hypothetical protein
MAPLTETSSGTEDLYPVVPLRRFYDQLGPDELRQKIREVKSIGKAVRNRLGHKRVVGVALFPWHDQTTLWWFEQGLISVMAAAGWDVTWITDAGYSFDDRLLSSLPGQVDVRRGAEFVDTVGADGPGYDGVVSLFVEDATIRLANRLDLPLASYSIKNIYRDEATLTELPKANPVLWHTFAGSRNFLSGTRRVLQEDQWQLRGAPFPLNRYYMQSRPVEPDFDVLIFGSKSRDYPLVLDACKQAGIQRVAAIANEEHVESMRQLGQEHGMDLHVSEPLSHLDLCAFLQRTRVVANPITPPAESHYSLSVPLGLGRPIVASDIPSVQPFVGPGLAVASLDDSADWAEKLTHYLNETAQSLPYSPALKQAVERHCIHRFFAASLIETLA